MPERLPKEESDPLLGSDPDLGLPTPPLEIGGKGGTGAGVGTLFVGNEPPLGNVPSGGVVTGDGGRLRGLGMDFQVPRIPCKGARMARDPTVIAREAPIRMAEKIPRAIRAGTRVWLTWTETVKIRMAMTKNFLPAIALMKSWRIGDGQV